MKLGYDLTIEQTQKLTMTPELIQAIQILQFNTQELDEFVQEELMQNPVLEFDRTSDDRGREEYYKTEELDAKACERDDIDLHFSAVFSNLFCKFKNLFLGALTCIGKGFKVESLNGGTALCHHIACNGAVNTA